MPSGMRGSSWIDCRKSKFLSVIPISISISISCPVDIIRFDEHALPYITEEEKCLTECTHCLKVCPADEFNFNFFDDEQFGARPHPDSITGMVKGSYVSFATDEKLRVAGTSGGFVTQILIHMLENGIIDGAVVLGTEAGKEGWRQKPFVARTLEDLKRAMKSKYLAVPYLDESLREIQSIDGNYAVVALPCYLHALAKYKQLNRRLRERIKLTIGLFCNVVFEPSLVKDLCEFNGVRMDDVADLHFRHGQWPGGVVLELKDGSTQSAFKIDDMKDQFNLLKLFYTPRRCNMCTDFSAEYADIAVGDPWLRGPDGNYLYEDNRTTVLTRTDAGEAAVRQAVKDGYIVVKTLPLKTFMVNFETTSRYKRDFVPKYLKVRRFLGLPTPDYNRTIGSGSLKGYRSLFTRLFILNMAKRFKWFRRLSLFLAQTRPALAWWVWNRKRKAQRFSRNYRRIESFVETMTPTVTGANGSEFLELPVLNSRSES